MSEPLVSIIIRSCNEGWALRDTLAALHAQSYRPWELIVIDSGSTDGSVDLIRQAHPRHFIQIRQAEYNPSRVMNQGMQLAQAEFGIVQFAPAHGAEAMQDLLFLLRQMPVDMLRGGGRAVMPDHATEPFEATLADSIV